MFQGYLDFEEILKKFRFGIKRFFDIILESFLRDYREFFERLQSFLRDCREYFEKVERDYKERVKN